MRLYAYINVKCNSCFRSHIFHCRGKFLTHLMSHIAQTHRRLILGNGLKTLNMSEVSGAEFSAVPMLVYDSILAVGERENYMFRSLT